jgi:LEA14-like dessication related protein
MIRSNCAASGILILLSLAGLGGCGMLEKPTAAITGMSLQEISPTNATMLFDVQVDNPYTVDLPLGNIDYALSSQGKPFLDGEAPLQGAIPAGGSKTLGVPVRISFLKLIETVKDARPDSSIPFLAELGLSVDTPLIGRMRLPMSREGELAIPSSRVLSDLLRDMAN